MPEIAKQPVGLHHVAYVCQDLEATHHFYEDLLGFRLVHTEVETFETGGFFRHTFYDLGDGTCIAFFDVHGVGEKEGWSSAISKGNGLPVWVNHVAFKADTARQDEVRARMDAAGVAPADGDRRRRHPTMMSEVVSGSMTEWTTMDRGPRPSAPCSASSGASAARRSTGACSATPRRWRRRALRSTSPAT